MQFGITTYLYQDVSLLYEYYLPKFSPKCNILRVLFHQFRQKTVELKHIGHGIPRHPGLGGAGIAALARASGLPKPSWCLQKLHGAKERPHKLTAGRAKIGLAAEILGHGGKTLW